MKNQWSWLLAVFATLCAFGLLFGSLLGCTKASVLPRETDGIIRGRSADQDQVAKAVVALVSETARGQALCTGTLLDESTVLTAAHCVDHEPSRLTVIFGSNVKTAANRREADGYIQHPRWTHPTALGHGDLAIVHFADGLPSGFRPVELAAKSLPLNNGTEVLMIGFGVSNGLSHAGAGVLRETSTQIIGEASSTELITDGRRSSVCFGDSGGPAFALSPQGHYVQWGVASSVTDRACNEASIHTNIQSYSKWIKTSVVKLKSPRSRVTRSPIAFENDGDPNDIDSN